MQAREWKKTLTGSPEKRIIVSMGRARALLCTATLIVAVAMPSAAQIDRFGHVGGPCFQGALALDAPVANVREFVPADFPLIQAGGRAALFAYTVECERVSVTGGPESTARLTGVAAFVRPPDGSPGVQAYDILMTADRRDYVRAHNALGLLQGLVRVGFERTTVAGPVLDITAETPWRYSPYRWNLTAIAPPPAGLPLTTVHWQDGRRGRVLIEYDHTGLIVTPGFGSLTAAAGSPLARLLGTEEVTAAPGAILQFSYSGTATLEP